ncbi:MAG: pilin [Candidatus Saccharibacteria bacterium]|nr:pilin [Candidatus Saccharibacteria bacterium]
MKKFLVFVALLIATLTTTNFTLNYIANAAPTTTTNQTNTDAKAKTDTGTSTGTEATDTGTPYDPSTDDPVTDRSSCRTFLGMYSWDCGLTTTTGAGGKPTIVIDSTDALKGGILIIISNVLIDLSIIATYIVVGYVIYGGYMYIFANGDMNKVMGGKKTLTRAFIGLAVVACTNIILNTIRFAFMGQNGAFPQNCAEAECVSSNDLIRNALGWIIGISGAIAAIFLVVGGIGYATSAGDSAKLQKAKNTIIYSLIGIAIVGLSQIATNFVIGIVNTANNSVTMEGAIQTILNSVIAVASVVSVVFVVIGGYNYITSTGDTGKLQKAKSMILYACIGLAVCALAFVIVNWAVGIVNTNSATPTPSP